MPKGRIGLSLSPDVMDILDKHGDREGETKPTRTEIIEAAVRLWDGLGMRIFTREELQKIMAFGQSEGVKRLVAEWKRSNGAAHDHTTERIDDDPEAESKARAGKERAVVVQAGGPPFESTPSNPVPQSKLAKPLDRERVSIPKPGRTKK